MARPSACYVRGKRSRCGCMAMTLQRRRRPSARTRGSSLVTWSCSVTGLLSCTRQTATAVWWVKCCYLMAGAWGTSWYALGWPGGIGSRRHTTPHERSPTGDEGMPAWRLRETSSATTGGTHMDTAATEVRAAPAAMRYRIMQLVVGIVCMVAIANLQYGWTLFVDPIHQKYQWGRPAIQLAFTIFILMATWLVPIEGWLIDKFGV